MGGFLTSFWNGLVTNPLTHELGIGPGLENMWNGAKYLSKCFGAVAGAAVDPSKTIFDVLDSPLESLSSQLSIAAP